MHEQDRAILLLILVLSHHCSAQIQGCSSQLLFQCFSPQFCFFQEPVWCLNGQYGLNAPVSLELGAGSGPAWLCPMEAPYLGTIVAAQPLPAGLEVSVALMMLHHAVMEASLYK